MAQTPAYTTLSALNAVLGGISQTMLTAAAASTLDAYPHASASEDENRAAETLVESMRQLFSTEEFQWAMQGDNQVSGLSTFSQTADGSGKIVLEPNVTTYHVIQVLLHPEDPDYGKKVVDVRQDPGNSSKRSLYNVTDNTFSWGASATKKIQVSWCLDFLALPAPAQNWVVAHARALLAQLKLRDAEIVRGLEYRAQAANQALKRWSLDVKPAAVLDAYDVRGHKYIYGIPPLVY